MRACCAREHEPLGDLLGELTSMIVLPYLGSAAARRERERPLPAPLVQARGARRSPKRSDRDPLQEVPMRLTYRTARVLACIAEQPGISNRVVAEQAGVADQGQISKLLARLERLGSDQRTGVRACQGRAQRLEIDALGQQVAQRLNVNSSARRAVA